MPASFWGEVPDPEALLGTVVVITKPDGSVVAGVDPAPPRSPAVPKPAEDIVDVLEPIFEIAEKMKRTLADRGWTYEAAEAIAVNYVNKTIDNSISIQQGAS